MPFRYDTTNESNDSYFRSTEEQKTKNTKTLLKKRLNKYLYQQELIRKRMMSNDYDLKLKNSGAISELRKLIKILENE